MSCSNETASSQGAFAVQYVALLLLILTFILGTYANAAATKQRQAAAVTLPPSEAERPAKVDENPFGMIVIDQAFDADGAVAVEKIESIAAVLKQHDVTARIEVSAQAKSNDPAATIFGRMLTLQAAFRHLGVPSVALDVRGSERVQNDSVVVSFRWSGL
jgi:hypothetical protein